MLTELALPSGFLYCPVLTRPSLRRPQSPPPPPAAASNQTWFASNAPYCNAPNDTALCVPAGLLQPDDANPSDRREPERRLTGDQYKALLERPSNTSVLDFHLWGTCMERGDALQLYSYQGECGEPGGPCGADLCGAANRTCPKG